MPRKNFKRYLLLLTFFLLLFLINQAVVRSFNKTTKSVVSTEVSTTTTSTTMAVIDLVSAIRRKASVLTIRDDLLPNHVIKNGRNETHLITLYSIAYMNCF